MPLQQVCVRVFYTYMPIVCVIIPEEYLYTWVIQDADEAVNSSGSDGGGGEEFGHPRPHHHHSVYDTLPLHHPRRGVR